MLSKGGFQYTELLDQRFDVHMSPHLQVANRVKHLTRILLLTFLALEM